MDVSFLERFSAAVVTRLVAADELVLAPGREAEVIGRLALHLATVQHASLVSSIARGLLAQDDVLELFADDDTIKAIVDGLDRRSAGM